MPSYASTELSALETYKLLIGLVVPRPIAWVGTMADGRMNLAPFSFFNTVSAEPPVIVFSPVGPPDKPKHTLRNITETGVFTHNVVSRSLTEAMNLTSMSEDVDEFVAASLTPVMGDLVAAPRVGEADASMECRLIEVMSFGSGNLSGNLVIGEVVRFHLRDNLVENFRVNPGTLDAVGRMAGNDYASTRDRFTVERPA